MRLAFTCTIVLIIIYACSCGINSWDISRYRNNFTSHREQYNKLVEGLKKCNLRVGYSVYESELPDDLQSLLQDLEITDVNLLHTTCDGKTDYQFESKWSTKAHLFFIYKSCELEHSATGYHVIMSQMIELWGLGNGWVMMIDHDFI
jgi:CRISPR/Cas system-associated endoribonuclease Cas2